MTVSVQELLAQAQRESGLKDYGDDWFMGPLAAYVSDLAGPQLSEWGVAFLTRLVLKDLTRRLAIVDCLKRNPAIEETPLPPIVYITGHERSGTTLLHNLLSLHESARYLSRWELMSPTPPPEAASFLTDPRRAEVQKSIDALRGSDLEKMHWVEAHDPEECVWGLMDCTGLLGMAPALIMPNWGAWMATNDMEQTFVNYRKVMQLLLWKNPVPEGGFLVLKSPQVVPYLPSFSRVFPEANFIYVHRDPYRVLASFCTLIEIVDGSFLESRQYLLDMERYNKRSLQRMRRYYAGLEAFELAHPERVDNVQYMELLAQPEAEIARLYSDGTLSADAQLPEKIATFLAGQKAGSRAQPRQQLTDYGYAAEEVRSDPQIARYLQHFKVLLEQQRQTGV